MDPLTKKVARRFASQVQEEEAPEAAPPHWEGTIKPYKKTEAYTYKRGTTDVSPQER